MTWNPKDPANEVSTSVVPCKQPHLVEIVSAATVPTEVTKYPDVAGWTSLDASVCTDQVTKYLGYALDPAGRFQVSALTPTSEGWSQGDRSMWCDIVPENSTDASPSLLMSGHVRGQNQEQLYPIGACLVSASGTSTVPCTLTHSFEISGNASLQSLTALPQGRTAMVSAVQSQCALIALGYVGGPLPTGVNWGFLYLAQSSWDAGERLVQCTVEHEDGSGNPVPSTGSLKG